MHRSYVVPQGATARHYVAVKWKFICSLGFALMWVSLSIWLSLPWLRDLAVHIGKPLAIITVGLLAFVPGFIVALLFCSLLLDRQPQLKPTSPTTAVTVMIAARNEAGTIAETLASLHEQDYEGPIRIILIDNGSTDTTMEIATRAARDPVMRAAVR